MTPQPPPPGFKPKLAYISTPQDKLMFDSLTDAAKVDVLKAVYVESQKIKAASQTVAMLGEMYNQEADEDLREAIIKTIFEIGGAFN